MVGQIENESRKDEKAVLEKTDARQGATPRVTRYVLAWGLVLVIVAFVIIYFVA